MPTYIEPISASTSRIAPYIRVRSKLSYAEWIAWPRPRGDRMSSAAITPMAL